ncbi:MAG: DUF4469 domain-containing protein [Carboxylicivirga sp.]|jgi:hypothetical protein|nr:DUF4469 domain-containing protein [Carboxylicivirga sp.]MCT4647857.1 DUF4469 domain-containing protein [Carboxylicivirga sp.]
MSKVSVSLYNNYLTPDPNDQFGRVNLQGSLNNEKIAEEIVKTRTEYDKNTIISILNRADQIKIEKMAEGFTISTGICHAHIGISGVFNGQTDRFDPNEHRITASFSSSQALRDELKKTQVEITGMASTEPVIGKVIDSFTKAEDSTITPNNVLLIKGDRIKMLGEDPANGVYLINQADSTRHQCTQIISNEPKKLMVMVPDVPAGDYVLEVITQFSTTNTPVKTPRSTQFEHLLIVE